MFLKKYTQNLRSLFTIFAVLALATAVLWFGANTSTTKANAKTGDATNAPSTVFSNTAAITINDAAPASPYPSNITVSGIGTVATVKVTLNSFDHTFPDDVDVLLVSPSGAKMIILSDAGGSTAAVDATITLDDAAATAAPDTGGIPTGTYKPANYGTVQDPFAAPAPAGPYATPAPGGTATLTNTFGGTNGDGVWSLYVVDDLGGDTGDFSGGWSLDITGATPPRGQLFDFTGDGKTDWTTLAIPTTAGQAITWKVLGNPANPAPNAAFIRVFNYGQAGDRIVPRDYTGDTKNEVTVWRPGATGIFYVAQFPTGTGGIALERAVQFGTTGDNPDCGGDYDGDGKIDFCVARFTSPNLTYYIMSSSTGTLRQIPFGLPSTASSFSAVSGADFVGDNKDEIVLLTIGAGNLITWYVGDATTGAGVLTRAFGNFATDFAVTPADYTGDGKADFVAVRQNAAGSPATWYINNSVTNATTGTGFGISDPNFTNNDRPVRGDYDGDGKQDIAVYRTSNRTFYVLGSTSGLISQQWGDVGDTALGTFGTF